MHPVTCAGARRRHRGSLRSALGALVALLGLAAADASGAADTPDAVRVFAAASLTNVLTEIGKSWADAGHAPPSLAFAASGTLAKQIEAGAPADLYASADGKWMDYLDARGLIDHASRRDLLATSLVLIAPVSIPGQAGPVKPVEVTMQRGFPIASAFEGKLCTGEPDVVPAGIYAKQALQALGWWDSLQGRIVGSDDVRAALAFVERGECALGIVYATDAQLSQKVRVLATFPAATHDPIVYPFALVKDARPAARAFFAQLASPSGAAVFARYGFTVLSK
jgi:molybdate transport system substrate-binding protein